jgi:hypothetical protein
MMGPCGNLGNTMLGHTLARSVRIIDQKWQNLEYLVMDGGSSDGTVSILEKSTSTTTFGRAPRTKARPPLSTKVLRKPMERY